jgi:mevalonate pyrophosphate decarboxylase
MFNVVIQLNLINSCSENRFADLQVHPDKAHSLCYENEPYYSSWLNQILCQVVSENINNDFEQIKFLEGNMLEIINQAYMQRFTLQTAERELIYANFLAFLYARHGNYKLILYNTFLF